MAATRLIALHKNKGKTVAACLKSRTDYVQNPDKTEQGELVSCHECSPLTVDEEFMLTKRAIFRRPAFPASTPLPSAFPRSPLPSCWLVCAAS